MIRRLLFALLIAASMMGQEAPPPQAVKALEHLKPQPNGGLTSWTNGT